MWKLWTLGTPPKDVLDPQNPWNSLEFPKIVTSDPDLENLSVFQPGMPKPGGGEALVVFFTKLLEKFQVPQSLVVPTISIDSICFSCGFWDFMDFRFFGKMNAVSWWSKIGQVKQNRHGAKFSTGAGGGAGHSCESGEIWPVRGGESPHWPRAAGRLSFGQWCTETNRIS